MSSLLNNASLLLNPAGSIISYQEDKIYSVLPRNGTGDFTFSGGDGGTRVNQQGYVEVTPANLINQSEAIGSSPWILNFTTVTANSTVAPNGTTTADTIANDGTNAFHRVYQGAFTGYGSPQTMSFSLYVKYNNHQYFSFGLTDDILYRSQVVVDLINGTITQNYVSTGGDTLTSTITNVGGGWYYVTGTFTYATSLSGGNAYFLCMLLNQSTFTSAGYVGTGTSVFVWGAMFNTGGVKPYQPTTDRLNYPRITYQNGRGALLQEPQRTNVATNSQTISAFTGTTVSLNSGISPDGTQNADKLIEDTSTGIHITIFGGSLGGSVDSSTFCVSIFAKAAERTRFMIFDNGQAAGAAVNIFDLGNGTKISGNGTIESYRDGWYRCIIFPSKTDSTTANIQIRLINTGTNDSYTGDGSSGMFFWGKQIETGSFPTSYIPTTSATVTRPADIASNTNASSLIGQSAGAVYFDFTLDNLCDGLQTNQPVLWYMKDGGTGERYVELISGNRLVYVEYNGAVIANMASSAINTGRHKCAIAYANNDMVFYVDGVQVGIDGSGTPSGFSTVSTQYYNSFYYGQCKVHSLAPYTSRLSNTQLAELTTVRSGSGGTISYYGPYTIHTFTGSATFTPSFNGEVEVLVVAGGGGGGTYAAGAGGGAGGLLYASSYGVSAGTGITVTIGAGGNGGVTGVGGSTQGSNSVFGALTAIGGGRGADGWSPTPGGNGGSGGGGAGYDGSGGTFTVAGGIGTVGQGTNGGLGRGISTNRGAGGGGGGAGQVGGDSTTTSGGNGGNGLPYSISGFSTYYAGGGGGGDYGSSNGGQGGLGGGGNVSGGNSSGIPGFPGVSFTGGGGGGSRSATSDSWNGGNGGSGVVIVRYLT